MDLALKNHCRLFNAKPISITIEKYHLTLWKVPFDNQRIYVEMKICKFYNCSNCRLICHKTKPTQTKNLVKKTKLTGSQSMTQSLSDRNIVKIRWNTLEESHGSENTCCHWKSCERPTTNACMTKISRIEKNNNNKKDNKIVICCDWDKPFNNIISECSKPSEKKRKRRDWRREGDPPRIEQEFKIWTYQQIVHVLTRISIGELDV